MCHVTHLCVYPLRSGRWLLWRCFLSLSLSLSRSLFLSQTCALSFSLVTQVPQNGVTCDCQGTFSLSLFLSLLDTHPHNRLTLPFSLLSLSRSLFLTLTLSLSLCFSRSLWLFRCAFIGVTRPIYVCTPTCHATHSFCVPLRVIYAYIYIHVYIYIYIYMYIYTYIYI